MYRPITCISRRPPSPAADAKAAKAEIKRARIRQEECDETLRQIHLVRDELETVGDRAQELLAKLLSLTGCGTDPVDLQWMQALVDEAVREMANSREQAAQGLSQCG